jgi:hypothetical protein
MVLLITACAGDQVDGDLTCDGPFTENSALDYGSEAVGHPTIEQAVEAVIAMEAVSHPEWRRLARGDMTEPSVEFRDARGGVYLKMSVSRWNGGWLVDGWESCVVEE